MNRLKSIDNFNNNFKKSNYFIETREDYYEVNFIFQKISETITLEGLISFQKRYGGEYYNPFISFSKLKKVDNMDTVLEEEYDYHLFPQWFKDVSKPVYHLMRLKDVFAEK